jgi:hypothetical protein
MSRTAPAAGASAAIRVRSWSDEQFAASRSDWDELVGRSDADPLFMSWGWQWRWWMHHARVLDATLRLAAVYAGDRLVGLAPFYSHKVVMRKLLRSQRLELIGIAWRDPRAMFSDYLDIIADRTFRDEVIAAIAAWLAEQPFWDELALCCTKRDGVAAQLAAERLTRYAYVREVDPYSGWWAQLPASFQDYVRRLDPGVRRKLFNQRRKLTDPRIEYANETDLRATLELLWQFSARRWEGTPPAAHIQSFHQEIAADLARTHELRLSRLIVAGETRSVLYNVQRAATVYYVQSGFDPDAARGVSLGYLHFGYAIEAACSERVPRFDFLAGRGRHRDYKQDLLTEIVPVVNYHVVRQRPARWLYAAYGVVLTWRHERAVRRES